MKIKDGFVLRKLADSHIVVPLGNQIGDFGSIIKLSESGAFLWQQLECEKTVDELVVALTTEYDVNKEKAKIDVMAFVDKLKSSGLLE